MTHSSTALTSRATDPRSPLDAMVGESPVMQEMFALIAKVAPTKLSVLITGETGTGKELVARAVHGLSDRSRGPFVVVNCSAIPESLIEAELFGHARGSFTGAIASHSGLIEEANGGTLFLDEVSALSPAVQVTLLRVLEEHTVRRVGSSQSASVNFRLVAATNENLGEKVQRGQFREDLYYRLNVFPLDVPPLRERREDIPLLAEHFRRAFAHQNGIVPPPFSNVMLERLTAMEWTGNVRELQHFVQRAIVLRLGTDDIRCVEPLRCAPAPATLVAKADAEDWSLEELERRYIAAVMRKTHGHRGRAAAILGIDRRTLFRKLSALSLAAANWVSAAGALSETGLLG